MLQDTNIITKIEPMHEHCFLHYLRIYWSDIKIRLNGIDLMLPNKIVINPIKSFKIEKIKKKRFASILLVKQSDILVGHLGSYIKPPNVRTSMGSVYVGTSLILSNNSNSPDNLGYHSGSRHSVS
jgi:hypothetical protein